MSLGVDARMADAASLDAATVDAAVADAPAGGADARSADGGGAPDATTPVDAAVSPCGVVADYVESNDPGNVIVTGTPETAPTFTGTSFTIGGCIDPLQVNTAQTPIEIDSDSYYVTVGGTAPVTMRFELTSPNAATVLPDLTMYLVTETGGQLYLVDATSFSPVVGGGLIGRAILDPGTYQLWVFSQAADLSEVPTSAVEYVVNVTEYTKVCPPATSPYAETETAPHNTNDVIKITYNSNGSVRVADVGTAETTNLTVNKDGEIGITGVSGGLVGDPSGYSDADTFKIATGPNVTELHLALNWPAQPPTDMDFYLFPSGDTSGATIVASGTLINNDDEIKVFSVDPNTEYFLWVGTYEQPPIGNTDKPYTIDICGAETFPSP